MKGSRPPHCRSKREAGSATSGFADRLNRATTVWPAVLVKSTKTRPLPSDGMAIPSSPRSPPDDTMLRRSRKSVGRTAPSRITRIRPPCSTTNWTVRSVGSWRNNTGALKPDATVRARRGVWAVAAAAISASQQIVAAPRHIIPPSRSAVGGLTLLRVDRHQLGVRGLMRLDDLLRLGHRVRVAIAVDLVGLDQDLLAGRRRVDTLVNRRHRARRHARAAVDALLRVDVEHRHRRELRLVLARMDAVDRADIDARGVFGADARIGDDEGHDDSFSPAGLLGSRDPSSYRALRRSHQRRGRGD